ncbi:FecCD family ABC transporter permease [Holophaga foetida]|uniref:FecCD family ABC transporter permease n=1 Tax=Holophaga foetida TaxID=35839 RepID=UPI0002473EFA|nr:iron ABC transporter permease [Holophaga foetida]
MKPIPILIFLALLLGIALVSLSLGKYPLPVGEVAAFLAWKVTGLGHVQPERIPLLENIVLQIRFPRILNACLIGGALSVSGASYQALFVNPLVSPGLLGVLAGASFGAALGMVFLKSWFAVQTATFLGGIAAVVLALFIARIYQVRSTLMLVLGGIISGAFFTALVSIVKTLADPYTQLPNITFWLMGNLTLADRATILRMGVPIVLGILGLLLLSRQLNALSMGDEEARSLGVHVEWIRGLVILLATLISTLTVVLGGIIGWVGLIIPHTARMLVGPNNESLLPVSALLGASYLLLVDDLSRTLFTVEVPIGIVTSLVGIPFFLLVMKNARKGWQ